MVASSRMPYGSIAARMAGVPVINNVTGLSTAFLSQGAFGWKADIKSRAGLPLLL